METGTVKPPFGKRSTGSSTLNRLHGGNPAKATIDFLKSANRPVADNKGLRTDQTRRISGYFSEAPGIVSPLVTNYRKQIDAIRTKVAVEDADGTTDLLIKQTLWRNNNGFASLRPKGCHGYYRAQWN